MAFKSYTTNLGVPDEEQMQIMQDLAAPANSMGELISPQQQIIQAAAMKNAQAQQQQSPQAPPLTMQEKLRMLEEERKMQKELEMEELKKLLMQRSQSALDIQKQGISQNEELLGKIAQGPTGLERVSPAAAQFIDFISGTTQLGKQFQPLPTEDERNQKMFVLQNMLQQQKKGLSDEENDLIKNQFSNREQGINDRWDMNRDLKIEENISKKYDTAMKEAEDKATQFVNLEQNLASGEYSKIASSLSNFARLVNSEKGALTEGDKNDAMPDTLERRLKQLSTYFGDPNAKLTNEVVKSMQEMTKQAKNLVKLAHRRKLERVRNSSKAIRSYGNSPVIDDLYNLNIGHLDSVFQGSPPLVTEKRKAASPAKSKGGSDIDAKVKAIEEKMQKLMAE